MKCTKTHNARAQPLFYSLSLLFGGVLVAVAVVVCLRWPNTVFARAFAARAQGFHRTNMPSIERSFYLLNTRTICVILLYNLTQCIDGFSLITKIC